MGKLLNDENFKHVNYHGTDLRKTFARIRKQQAEERTHKLAKEDEVKLKVRSIIIKSS